MTPEQERQVQECEDLIRAAMSAEARNTASFLRHGGYADAAIIEAMKRLGENLVRKPTEK